MLEFDACGPLGSLFDPLLNDGDLRRIEEALFFWRHDHVVIGREDEGGVDGAFGGVALGDAGAVFVAFGGIFESVDFEIALVFVGAMAMHTGGFQDRFDLLIEVDFLGEKRRREGEGD